MNKRIGFLVAVCGLVAAGIAIGQGRILDMVANKVVTKYQSSSCEQLWEKKGQPKSRKNSAQCNSSGTTRRRARRSSTRSPDRSRTRCSSAE